MYVCVCVCVCVYVCVRACMSECVHAYNMHVYVTGIFPDDLQVQVQSSVIIHMHDYSIELSELWRTLLVLIK